MSRFVVFLRAINVGGHNTVKGELPAAFVSLGFCNVSTYGQSGNVIFETEATDSQAVKKQIEEKISVLLGHNVGVFIRTMEQLKRIIDLDPFKAQIKEGTSFWVTFLGSTPENILKFPTIIPNSSAEIISAVATEVFSVTREYGDGGKPNPFLEAKLKQWATTRSWNVINKIAANFA